nr:unnamed protein product [Digitaria exilis]
MAILDLDQARNSNSSTTAPPCHAAYEPPASSHQRRLCQAGCDKDAEEEEAEEDDLLLLKGVRHLCERRGGGGGAITRLPARYVLPPSDRPAAPDDGRRQIPVVDLARLRAPAERGAALAELDAACRDYGIFQLVGAGAGDEGRAAMLDVACRFFDLPFGERARHMSGDIRAPVRYGTSFNQLNDGVLCWRDFLKLVCDDLDDVVPSWPDAPLDLRCVR